MLFRVRQVLAVVLMAGSAAGIVAGLVGWWFLDFALSGFWVVAAALLVGAIGMAVGVWWARLIALAWSASVAAAIGLAMVAVEVERGPALVLAGALLLGLAVSGRQMFARYEGSAPPPLDWRLPGMRLVRVALVANLYTFFGSVASIPAIYEVARRHYEFAGRPEWGRFGGATGMTAVMLVGLILLARQRTAGLLLLAVSAFAVPAILVSSQHMAGSRPLWIVLLMFGPGILCGWLALGRFVPGMVRLLRR